jgi:hypothetical protein
MEPLLDHSHVIVVPLELVSGVCQKAMQLTHTQNWYLHPAFPFQHPDHCHPGSRSQLSQGNLFWFCFKYTCH